MNFKCLFGLHDWNGCTCRVCGKTKEHNWNGCKCSDCGKTRDQEHSWDGCTCSICSNIKEHLWQGCKCSACGETRDYGHDWRNDCGKCIKCGKVKESVHNWQGCKCLACGQLRDEAHFWDGCTCSVCGKIKDHMWQGCKCSACGQTKDHSWQGDKCSVCGETRGQDHSNAGPIENPKIVTKKYDYDELIRNLKNPDVEIRCSACVDLGDLADCQAVPLLVEALDDRNEYVGRYAAEALGKIGDMRALPFLENAKKNKSRFLVSVHADDALRILYKNMRDGLVEKYQKTNPLYFLYDLDISPTVAATLSLEDVSARWTDLKISDLGNCFECMRGDNTSVLLYFNKPRGLFQVVISDNADVNFLGMLSGNPEEVWCSLGFRLYENETRIAKFTDGHAQIGVLYGNRRGGVPGIIEMRYSIPRD